MPRIDIDDAVFSHLQKNAIAFVETPNDTIRRLLGLSDTSVAKQGRAATVLGKRQPRASLGRLVSAGRLKNGQEVFLRDYQGRQVPNAVAYIGGDGIFSSAKKDRLYSMSDLAQVLLKKQGYQSDSVRGPAHWYTAEGKSIAELWEEYLGSAV